MTNKKEYKIVLVESSPIIIQGLQELLRPRREFSFVAVLQEGKRYPESVRHLSPDILIVNPLIFDSKQLSANDFSGDSAPVIVALSYQYLHPDIIRHYSTVIDINDDREKIVQKLQQALALPQSQGETSEGNELSEREKEILISVAKGMINKEIAEQHHISIHTVITHRKNITRKTGIKSISGLTVFAILNNLIDMSEVE